MWILHKNARKLRKPCREGLNVGSCMNVNFFSMYYSAFELSFTLLTKQDWKEFNFRRYFNQSVWVKINWSWIYFHFFILCVLLLTYPICFVGPIKQILNFFYIILNFHFKYQILHTCKLANLSWRKSTQVREGAFSLGNEWNWRKMSCFQSLRVKFF